MSLHEIAELVVSKDDELAILLNRLHLFDKSKYGEIKAEKIQSTCVDEDDKADLRAEAIEVIYRILKIACQRTNQEHNFSAGICISYAMTDS